MSAAERDAAQADGIGLAGVREEVEQLVRQLDGPVARVVARSGEAMIEIEWSRPAEPGPPAAAAAVQPQALPQPANGAVSANGAGANGSANGAPGAAPADEPLQHAVCAPLVGTFYVAPEPNASPFVRPGDVVDASTTIGIIEAMKMMNHISAERAGRVRELLVANGEAVEFGQELVRIEPVDG